MGSSEKAILKTLLYADIFNFPLKKNEIWSFLITEKKISKESLFKNISSLNRFIEYKNNYFYIQGKKNVIHLRQKRENESVIKLLKAKTIINTISFIPTIKFIGISGALSMKNSDKNDDIDVFVISKKGFAWTTRFIIVLTLIFLGNYRYKNSKDVTDKICLNMVLDEDNLIFKYNNQNLYTAHEIIQLIPMFDKDNTYIKFIIKNNWVNKYLANYYSVKKYNQKKENLFDNIIINIFNILFLEEILRFIQIKYMRKSISSEIIDKGFLAFHPFNYKDYVLRKYKNGLKKYKI